MVGSINIPANLTKVVEVKDTSDVLKRFLTDLAIKVDNLEKTNKALELRVYALEHP